jgi:hypothetical protein
MPLLDFDYDSSYPDTDPFQAQSGGCCTWLPFFNDGLVELPITLPQDHTLFVILRHRDEREWVEKTAFLRKRGGLALLITHPDYLYPEPLLRAYVRYLHAYAGDDDCWHALPREITDWWRRRSISSLQRDNGRWRIVGPAVADGSVAFAASQPTVA